MKRSRKGSPKKTARMRNEDSSFDHHQTTSSSSTRTASRDSGSGSGFFPILELPACVIYEILSRLPFNSVFCCRCVCRTFRDILRDPYFAKLHHARASAALIFRDANTHLLRLYLADPHQTSPSSFRKHRINFLMPSRTVAVVGSCNGFLCFYSASSRNRTYCICNPLLGEYILPPAPPSPTLDYSYQDYSGFGFSPKTNQYKIIRFVSTVCGTVAEVHTIGTSSWRNIGAAPSPKHRGSFYPFLDGAIHWIVDDYRASNLICSFDIEKERFEPVSPPAHFDANYTKEISWINVGVLGDSLCLCYVLNDAHFAVWVMKDYGIKESWTKKFTIDINFYCGLRVGDKHWPIGFMNNGDMLLRCNSNSVVCYSPRKGSFKDLKSSGTEAVAHIPGFLSLKDALMGTNLKVQNIKLGKTENLIWGSCFLGNNSTLEIQPSA